MAKKRRKYTKEYKESAAAMTVSPTEVLVPLSDEQ
jgi:transposase-like protein